MTANPYIYFDETVQRWYDPLTVRRALLRDSAGQFNEWLAATRSATDGSPAALAAYDKLIPVARRAFDLPPIDPTTGTGVAEEQVVAVVDAFLRWLAGKAPRG